MVIAPKFDKAFPFSEGLAKVALGNKAGFIDKTGKIIIAPQFYVESGLKFDFGGDGFREGLAAVRINGKVGYIDKRGKLAIPARYKLGGDFNGGLVFVVSDEDKVYFIDKTGKVVIELKK